MLEWGRLGAEDCLRLRGGAALAGGVAVYPASAALDPDRPLDLPPVAGRYELDGDDLCFLPRFGFVAGTAYVVVAGSAEGDGEVWRVAAPAVGGDATTTVLGIEPEVAALPRNALRVAIRFSAPMSEGVAARHIRLVDDATGEEVPNPFTSMDPELWDGDRQRLTVLLDPARIKRGLVPHDEVGYPLVEGASVRLVVDAGFPDAAGRPLVAGSERRYEVGPDERRKVEPSSWAVSPPAHGTTDPVVVRFERALDGALVRRCLTVEGVAGVAGVATGQDAWSFTPDDPWGAVAHTLVVDPRLEDLAGNSVARVFDRDLRLAADDPAPPGPVRITFTPT